MPSVERWISCVSAEVRETVANEFTHRKRHAKVTGFRVTDRLAVRELQFRNQLKVDQSHRELWNRKRKCLRIRSGRMLESWQLPTAASNAFANSDAMIGLRSHAKVTIFRAELAESCFDPCSI